VPDNFKIFGGIEREILSKKFNSEGLFKILGQNMSNLYIGTSGWVYGHWEGIFYPEDLPSKDKLRYYSQHFKTAGINYSFYHLPRPSTYQNWYSQVPEDFVFAVKASRFITHIKRLKGVGSAWNQFLENALNLKEKLGPILFQFPPSFQATDENLKRLEEFLKLITKNLYPKPYTLKFAFEFRHKSFCDEKIYKLLKKYNVAWVIADSPRYPRADVVTADFVYIRMHGSKIMFASKYTKEELKDLAKKIKKWLKQKLDVYIYFNNDAYGYAIENAKELLNYFK
jgi:uncharacterized protein YecE (DUF72 family)